MQPTYLPWIGYFHLIDQVDAFVFLDDVQYNHRSWQQRNRIKSPAGPIWLTVPVRTSGRSMQLISEVEIQEDIQWALTHKRLIQQHYASAPETMFMDSWMEETYSRPWRLLSDLNQHVIKTISHKLGLKVDFIKASSLGVGGRKARHLVNICDAIGGTTYVSALGSKEYIEADDPFPDAGIALYYQHFVHPDYLQAHGEFVPHLSILDLLLNVGTRSLDVIRSGGRPLYTSEEARRIPGSKGREHV